jgi:hypothetical protein
MDTHVAEHYVGFGYSEPFFKGAEHFGAPSDDAVNMVEEWETARR